MKLNELADNPGARRDRKRVGRGIGSGLGPADKQGSIPLQSILHHYAVILAERRISYRLNW